MGARGNGQRIRGNPLSAGHALDAYLQADYLTRFEKRETKMFGGASFGIARTWNCAAEISVAPGRGAVSAAAVWLEIGKMATRSLVMYGRVSHSAYLNSSLSGISLAGESIRRDATAP